MADDQTPADVLAEISKAIGEPTAQDGGIDDASGDQQNDGGDNGLAEFQDNPQDAPAIAQLKKQLRATMTKRTTEIAGERRRIKEQAAEFEQAKRDAEMFRALKDAQDPHAAVDGLIGKRSSPNGIVDPDAILTRHKQTFDEPTYAGITDLARAVFLQEAQKHFSGPLAALNDLYKDRTDGEKSRVVAEYGDDASRWMEAAEGLRQQFPNASLKQRLLLASDGQVSLSKIRATVADARKRAATPPSVAPSSVVQPKKIGLSREERTALVDQLARKQVAAGVPGAERFLLH